MDQMVTLHILKKVCASTGNHWLLYMIKEIPYKRQYKIQTKFGILDCLYPTSGLNIIFSVDQDTYWLNFQNNSFQTIFLPVVTRRVGTSDKVAIMYLCKNLCNPRS